MTLEEELGGLLRAVGLAARQRRAVARRLGWDGGGPATLADAGAAHGYTRERVRQLEERVAHRVGAAQPELPVTRAALAVVRDAAPASHAELADLLADRGLSARPFAAGGVLSAAAFAGIDVEVVTRQRGILRREDLIIDPVVAHVTKRLVARDGATTAAAVATLTGLSRRRVRRLLELAGTATWLEGTDGWLTIVPVTGRVGSALRKLVSFSPSADPDDVRAALATLRPPVRLPVEVVARLVELVSSEEMDDELTVTERLLVGVIRDEGGRARLTPTSQKLQAAGMSAGSAAVCLGRSPLFRRVERGVWTLAVGSAA